MILEQANTWVGSKAKEPALNEELDTNFGSRREARETALNILYAADNHEQPLTEYLQEQPVPPEEFVSDLIEGIFTHLERIDSIIDQFAEGWSTERMPTIDKALLRMATYEVLCRPDIPIEAILSEAVALASEYSTEQSSRFINGVVASISEEVRTNSN